MSTDRIDSDAEKLTLNKETLQDLDVQTDGDVRGGAIQFQATTVCLPKYETTACISVGVQCRPTQGPTCGG